MWTDCLLIKVCIFLPIHELIWDRDKNELKQEYDSIALHSEKIIKSDNLKMQMENHMKYWYWDIGESLS